MRYLDDNYNYVDALHWQGNSVNLKDNPLIEKLVKEQKLQIIEENNKSLILKQDNKSIKVPYNKVIVCHEFNNKIEVLSLDDFNKQYKICTSTKVIFNNIESFISQANEMKKFLNKAIDDYGYVEYREAYEDLLSYMKSLFDILDQLETEDILW